MVLSLLSLLLAPVLRRCTSSAQTAGALSQSCAQTLRWASRCLAAEEPLALKPQKTNDHRQAGSTARYNVLKRIGSRSASFRTAAHTAVDSISQQKA